MVGASDHWEIVGPEWSHAPIEDSKSIAFLASSFKGDDSE